MKLSNIARDKRILIMGKGGTGKTTVIGTLCKIMRTLVITADVGGLETLATMGVDPEVINIGEWRKITEYHTQIMKAVPNFKAIAIDDFGAVQTSARQKIEKTPKGYYEEHMKDFQIAAKRGLMLGERRLGIQDWGNMWTAMETFLSEVLSSACPIKLVTVLEGPDTDPRTGDLRLYPQLQGSIRHTLSARFSLVAETFIAEHGDDTYYCLTSKSHPRVETKTRYGQGRTWVDPDMLKVLAYINKKGGEESKIEEEIGVGLE